MKKMELGTMTPESLKELIAKGRRALLNWRFQKQLDSEPVKPHLIRKTRRDIARCKTVLSSLKKKKG